MRKTAKKRIVRPLARLLVRKLLLAYVAFGLVITSAHLFNEYRNAKKDIQATLESLVETFSPSVESALWDYQAELLKAMASGIGTHSMVASVNIGDAGLGEAGRVLSTSWRDPANLTVSTELVAQKTLYRKEGDGKKELGYLRIASSDELVITHLMKGLRSIVIVASAQFVFLGFLLWLLARVFLVKPLADFSSQVRRLSIKGVEQSITLKDNEVAEIDTLQNGFNQLMSQLADSYKQIAEQNVGLEGTVAERTQRLSEALAFSETVLLNSPLSMGVYSKAGDCVLANEAYAQLVGVKREALLGENFHHIAAWKSSGFLDDCLVALATEQPKQRELNVQTSFGESICLECRLLPIQLNGEKHLLIQLVDLTERKRIEEELRQHAFHDALTHLPNRRLFLDRLQQAMHTSKRQKIYFALLFLDLNKFKQLNDTFGHDIGDQLLLQVARRLRQVVRDRDTVARFGGDEFVILLEGLSAQREEASGNTRRVVEKVRAALSEPYVLSGVQHFSAASIGSELFMGDEIDANEMLKLADAAMYKEKNKH